MPDMHILLLACALALPGTASAAAVPVQPAPGSEHRLSSDQVDKILDEAARKRELAEMAAPDTGPAIHGEIGFTVGTGGYRSAYGTAAVPLPGEGVAILSFSSDHFENIRPFNYRER
jgi:hypothetical protein